MPKKKRPKGWNKFGAVKTEIDGFVFDSKKEAKRYCELKILQQAGQIANLVTQPPYPLKVNGYVITTYKADFRYNDLARGGAEVVEDCKGMRTPEYKIKKKLMLALYKIEIFET